MGIFLTATHRQPKEYTSLGGWGSRFEVTIDSDIYIRCTSGAMKAIDPSCQISSLLAGLAQEKPEIMASSFASASISTLDLRHVSQYPVIPK